MCALVLYVPIIINGIYKPVNVTYFGWGFNILNRFYFRLWGYYPIFTNPEPKVLSFCAYEELHLLLYL